MGFFSSRRAEPEPLSEHGAAADHGADKTLAQVIRSKFYTKSKLRERVVVVVGDDEQGPYAPAAPPPPARPATVPQTDNVTMSLAQRLNELASANEKGLLDDDQYRLLRQNLFERFTSPGVHADAGQARIPQPTAGEAPSPVSPSPASARPPSVRSSRSVATAMSSLFRRGTTTRSNSQESLARSSFSAPPFDSASVRSGRPSLALHAKQPTHPSITVTSSSSVRMLRQQSSFASITSDATSTTHADAMSIVSRRTGHRSTKSRGPPSSFNVRFHDQALPDDRPHDQATLMAMSSDEIRAEIAHVEAEGRRLLDAFSGLELSTLAKHQREGSVSGRRGLERSPSTWTLVPNDAPAAAAAAGIVPSPSAPALSRKPSKLKANGSLLRSNSSIRGGSSSHLPLPPQSAPPTVSVPRVSASAGNSPTSPVAGETVADAEVAEIRRKRDEVRARYERKIEYLQAMVRNAEIREKLAKKEKRK